MAEQVEIIQMYADEAQTKRQFPITTSGAVMHGENQTIDQVVEGLKVGQTETKEEIMSEIGDRQNLQTKEKNTIVGAINEVHAYAYSVYGVRHMYENASSGLTRIGNEILHATLPVQRLIRRCVLKDDGTVAYYLKDDNSNYKEDGTLASLDGTDGQVMVEIPQHYRRFTDHTDLKAYDCEISLLPFEGAHKVNRCYISAYQATVHRSDNKLSSVASMSAEYRGGNNNSAYDGTYRTQLGRPASGNISLTSARTYAHNRGTGWEQLEYDIYVALYWLYVVEYANLNSQLAFNASRTDKGFRQGGLGAGVTAVNGTQWSEKFGYYPFVPCGITNTLGNNTGVVAYDVPDTTQGAVWTRVSVPSYRGAENPFGQIWQWCDGFLGVGNGTKQEYLICHNRQKYASSRNDGYQSIGMSVGANGYMKTMLRTRMGDILAASIGGGDTTWFADYHYEAFASGTIYGLRLGGAANDGAAAGFVFGFSYYGPSDTSANLGSRLCYFNGTYVVEN